MNKVFTLTLIVSFFLNLSCKSSQKTEEKPEPPKQVYKEIKAQYPTIESFVLQPSIVVNDSIQKNIWISNLKSKEKINTKERIQMKEWLKVRLNTDEIIMNFEN